MRTSALVPGTMAAVTDRFRVETFRPAFGRGLAGALIALCALAAIGMIGAGTTMMWNVLPWLALVGFGGWAVYWRPEVRVDAAGVHVVNVFRTFDVPWPAIDEIETKWALTLVTRLGTVKAWAAPAPGRQVMRSSLPEDRRLSGAAEGDFARPSDLAHTESGAAALIVRQRWVALRRAGYLDDAKIEFERMPVRWHWEVVGGAAVLVTLVVYGTWVV